MNELSVKDFNFVGIGSMSISLHNLNVDIALQPFMVSRADDGVYEALALNFGILAGGFNEEEAMENLANAVLAYIISYISINQPVRLLNPDEQLKDFVTEYLRLSIIQKMQNNILNHKKFIDKDTSTLTNYYRVA